MIAVYITDEGGKGHTSLLTTVECIEELRIYTNHIGKDCVLTFVEVKVWN